MAKEEYVEASQVLASLPPNGLVKVYVPNSNEGGAFYDSQEFYIVAGNSLPNSGVWTPTVSNETNCTVSLSEWNFIKVGNVVNFGGFLRVDLDGGQTSGSFNLDLPSEIQPANNWSLNTDLNATLSMTSGVFTSTCTLIADGSGSKLIVGSFNDTSTGASIRVAVQGSFVTNN